MNERKIKIKTKECIVQKFKDRSEIQKSLLKFIELNKTKIIEECFHSSKAKK
ncbi:hypothetical protein [Vibrio parahaemolyticus]|uniref:hypothetical protein n=1 Tax=Vibrio parahaemolyticus TaxID=670 RepID=UPI0015DEEFA9|nr:hypothetical protein [Vibrio parahaemolyticus]